MSRLLPEDISSREVAKNGGRFVAEKGDFPSLVPFFQSFRDRAISRIDVASKYLRPNKPTPWIYFNLVDNPLLDATAFRSEDHYFIGVNMGTPLLLFDIFSRMMSCSDVLTLIGNSAIEAVNPALVPKLYSDADYIDQVVENGVTRHAFVVPKDPARAEFAKFLTHIAMDFLISHEFAHIMMGHLLLSEQEGGFPLMSEARWHSSEAEKPLLQQALEWDADDQATGLEVHLLFAMCDDLKRVPSQWRPFFKGYLANLYIWCFAVYTLFQLMGDGEYQVEKLPSNSHPPPSIRQAAVSAAVRGNIQRKRPYLLKGYEESECGFEGEKLVFRGLSLCASFDVSRLVMMFTGADQLAIEALREGATKGSLSHFERVKAELNSIRPKLRIIAQSQGTKV